MRIRPGLRPTLAWRLLQLLAALTLVWGAWRLLGHTPYRIDIDVYRMGGRAWLNNTPLYNESTIFRTEAGIDLPFTYPPLAAIMFAPFAWLPLPGASVAITVTTFVLLLVSIVIVLTRLDVWPQSQFGGSALARRCWLAAAIVGPAVLFLEPVRSNFNFGQINVVLMTLVIADCVPRRTPWPRGVLLGVAIALKLTPAVFLLYFLLRRDFRALLTTVASSVAVTLFAFALAWGDSWEYWTKTVRNTDRIGTATLNTNQNISGTLARFGMSATPRFVLWVVLCFAVLALTVWAAHRVLAGVVVAPLGVGGADLGDHHGARLPGTQRRPRGGQRRRGVPAGLYPDPAAARAPRGGRDAVAPGGRQLLCVVGAGRHCRGGHHHRPRHAVSRRHRARRADLGDDLAQPALIAAGGVFPSLTSAA